MAAIAAFYAMSAAAGWTFGVASASLAVAASLICVALGSTSYVKYRRSKPARRITSRLNNIGLPPRPDDQNKPVERVEHATASGESLNDKVARARAADDDGQVPPQDLQVADLDPFPLETDLVARIQSAGETGATTPLELASAEPEPTPAEDTDTGDSQPEPSAPPVPAPGTRVVYRDRTVDPKRLAALLNLYEHTGFPPDGHFDQSATDGSFVDGVPDHRSLWAELVAEYGAESIDLREAETGQCQITLTSGDLVFYSPERRCWLWIAFEQTGPAPSSLTNALSFDTMVVDSG